MDTSQWPAFYFVRHGETDYNLNGIITGQDNPPLNETGKEQARQGGKILRLNKPNLDIFVTSSLWRCTASTTILNEVFKGRRKDALPEVQCDKIIERTAGEYDGKFWTDLPETCIKSGHGYNQRHDGSVDFTLVKGAETDEEVQARVFSGLNHHFATHPNKRICYVAHSGTAAAIGRILGIKDHIDAPNGVPLYFYQCPKGKGWRFDVLTHQVSATHSTCPCPALAE